MSGNCPVLVGDVGGTHARFAVVDPQVKPLRAEVRLDLPADQFETFEAALEAYVAHIGTDTKPRAAAIGVAGPVTRGRVDFTNRDWHASEENLHRLGFSRALLINDFAAVSFCVSALHPDDLHAIGPEIEGMAEEPITVVGAGTGFGVSCLARYRQVAVPVATEGGHTGFAPQGEAEIAVLVALERRFGRISVERVLSGPGLANIHEALQEMEGQKVSSVSAAEIVESAGAGDATCRSALGMFCAIFGSVAGDFALAHGARGGVYIAGGIAKKIENVLRASRFRARFEDKGRLSHYVQAIPTRLILNDDAALLGAALASVEFGRDS
ncbi:MAG TPA: glucokinase [Rhizomicrobium sp.]|nr:glucokinase [Rhizomicrobium sp.]